LFWGDPKPRVFYCSGETPNPGYFIVLDVSPANTFSLYDLKIKEHLPL
jgi:hypothetical protein